MKNNLKQSKISISSDKGVFSELYQDIYFDKTNFIQESKHVYLDTNNLENRLNKHNSNKGAKSTKGYKWLLIYSKKFKSKNDAMSFEYKLKKDKNMRKKILENSI